MKFIAFLKGLFCRKKEPWHPKDCECPACVIGKWIVKDNAANNEMFSKMDKMNSEYLDFTNAKAGENMSIKLPDYPRTDK